jgi:hypothetical protein
MFDNSAKLESINDNLTGFFQDIVKFIEMVWNTLKKFFKLTDADPDSPLYAEKEEGQAE